MVEGQEEINKLLTLVVICDNIHSMNKVDVVNEFVTETFRLQEQLNKITNRLVPAFRLGNSDLEEFKMASNAITVSAEKLSTAFAELEEE